MGYSDTTDFESSADALASLTTSRPPGHGAVRAYDWIDHHAANRGGKEAVRDLGSGRSCDRARWQSARRAT